jgi:hypothetical protein
MGKARGAAEIAQCLMLLAALAMVVVFALAGTVGAFSSIFYKGFQRDPDLHCDRLHPSVWVSLCLCFNCCSQTENCCVRQRHRERAWVNAPNFCYLWHRLDVFIENVPGYIQKRSNHTNWRSVHHDL